MKNVGVPETPLRSALATSSCTRGAWLARAAGPEAVEVEAERLGVARQVVRLQLVLMVEQPVVHRPERALLARRLGRLGGDLRVRVHVVERQVAPDVAQVVAERVEQLADGDLGLPAVRALVVAVLDERDRRVGRAADVVARGVDVVGEVEESLGGAADLARAQTGGQRGDHAEGDRRPRAATTAAGENADLRLLQVAAPRSAMLAISSETVKPMPADRAARR